MTFEEWWGAPEGATECERIIARVAWDYQQQRIDELETKLKVVMEIALRRGKILEEQFEYLDE